MSKRIPIFVVTPDALVNMYKNNEEFNESNLVIFHEKRIPICKIFYKNVHIKANPYQLTGEKRNEAIAKNIFQYLIDEYISRYQKGNRAKTIDSQMQYIFNFIEWIDNVNKTSLPKSLNDAKVIFLNYSLYLKEKLRLDEISNFEGHVKHKAALKLLENVFLDSKGYIQDGQKLIQNKRAKASTSVSKFDLEYSYRFYYQFFNQTADFILNDKFFPLQLDINNNKIWTLPSKYRFIQDESQAPMAFNILNGSIKTEKEILQQYPEIKQQYARDNIRRFANTMDGANKYKSTQKLNLGLHALRAFYMLFLANTGMNDSTASTLKWNDDYKEERSLQKFRNIKYRAGNKFVEFQIRKSFIGQFSKFIKLRKYLLGDSNFEFLFFTGKADNIKIDKTMKYGGYSSWINRYFKKKIDKKLPDTTSRKMRVAKTKATIKQHGIIAASQVAQTSIDTLITHYQGTSKEDADTELSQYFNKLNGDVFSNKITDDNINVGHCSGNNSECKTGEGCLFCEHYRIHCDREDFQKLFSLEFIILECKYIAKDMEHFESNYRKTLVRIDEIVKNAIRTKKISKQDIEFYKNDVFENENLHPYWQHKLDTLILMGVMH
jgi:hypothetical protein